MTDTIKQDEINRRVLERMASGNDWFDIESAPRDGTVVLVRNGAIGGYGGGSGESSTPYSIGTAYLEDALDCRGRVKKERDWMADACCDGVSTYNPTHWKHTDSAKHIEMLIKKEMK